MIFRLLIALISLLFISCGDSAGHTEGSSPQSGEVSIAHLKSLCKGDHYAITADYSIRGIIVATDWCGEMNKSAVVVDRSGGLEFAIDVRNINERLPIYSEVTIFCNGLTLARIGGKIELGTTPTGDFPLGNIDDEMIDRYIRIEGICEDFVPATKRITEIGVGDVSAFVMFKNLRICDAEQGLAWCDIVDGKPTTTLRTLVDREGNTLAIRTLATCDYAEVPIPTKEISVAGIVDFADNRYFLRIANRSIIQ